MNQKDLKRFKKMLEDSKTALLESAKKTLMEESNFDTDDLPDEIDLASSEYAQSMVFRLRDREKFLLKKIEKALAAHRGRHLRRLRALRGADQPQAPRGPAGDHALHPLQGRAGEEGEVVRLSLVGGARSRASAGVPLVRGRAVPRVSDARTLRPGTAQRQKQDQGERVEARRGQE